LGLLQSELGLTGQANAIFVAGSSAYQDAENVSALLAGFLKRELTLDDWGLRLRSPKHRALAFLGYLAPNDEEGRLRPARWRGRVPEELAQAAEANKGILTREQVVAFYEKH